MPQEYRNLSFWHDTVPGALEPRPALDGDHRADVVIVGAGYTGLWTAWYLKQAAPALDITVLEAEIAGFGASGRNGGWCSGYLSGIEPWLEHPPTREAAIRLQRLMFDTVGEVGAFCREEAVDCHFEHSGALEIAVIPAQLERLREELAFLRRFGFDDGDYRWLERAEMAGALRVADAEAAIHMSHCAAVHPSRLARGSPIRGWSTRWRRSRR